MAAINPFSFAAIPLEDYKKASYLMIQWQEAASFPASKVICAHLASCFEKPKSAVFSAAFICKDKENNTHSVALIKVEQMYAKQVKKAKPYLKVVYIATAPSFAKQGAGTFLMHYLAKLSVEYQTCGLYVNSIESAKSFYEKKLHFKPLAHPLMPYDDAHDGQYPMLLSAEKIAQLLPKT
jgi:ribosomal protein S18 acetylase RimI-like enzyme